MLHKISFAIALVFALGAQATPNFDQIPNGQLSADQLLELGFTPVEELKSEETEFQKEIAALKRAGVRDRDLAKVVVVVNKSVRTSSNPKGQTAVLYRNIQLDISHEDRR